MIEIPTLALSPGLPYNHPLLELLLMSKRSVRKDGKSWSSAEKETLVTSLQRTMIALGYSTTTSGACVIDGDFGNGTNRGMAQAIYDLTSDGRLVNHQTVPTRKELTPKCTWQNSAVVARDLCGVAVTARVVEAMFKYVKEKPSKLLGGDPVTARRQLDAIERGRLDDKGAAMAGYRMESAWVSKWNDIRPAWLMAVVLTETGGINRPRFEQHYFSRLAREYRTKSLREIRFLSMSMGLGQIMGVNYKAAGAESPEDLFTADTRDQLSFIANFLDPMRHITMKLDPSDNDFRKIAKYYNGPGYAKNNYDKKLKKHFNDEKTKFES